jgi:UDP-MurNAc hydroxylase
MRATSIGHAGIVVETQQATIVCDPWFVPAFFASWFVFPRNDQLSPELMAKIEHPDYLYISHQHGDHLDEAWLANHIDKSTPVLLPAFATRELERRLSLLGFTNFIRTTNGEEMELRDGLKVAIHVESAIADGPGGDSALVISDGTSRLVNQNDCRTSDLHALLAHGPVDMHWLQFSGAIWYPMVYEEPREELMRLARAKVESQFARALKYVEVIGARAVVPSAGPPCFLDNDLFGNNMITGDELSIFPDQTEFIKRMDALSNSAAVMNIPGTAIEISPTEVRVMHPVADAKVREPFENKAAYLQQYQADWAQWLTDCKATWPIERTDLIATLQAWWGPLLAMAPMLRAAVGGGCVMNTDDLSISTLPLVWWCRLMGSSTNIGSPLLDRCLRRWLLARPLIGLTRCFCRVDLVRGVRANTTNTCTTSLRACRWSACAGPNKRWCERTLQTPTCRTRLN